MTFLFCQENGLRSATPELDGYRFFSRERRPKNWDGLSLLKVQHKLLFSNLRLTTSTDIINHLCNRSRFV